MPSPIGHTLLGLAFYVQFRPHPWRFSFITILLIAFASNLPDFDFIFGFLEGDPNRYHRGISHSFAISGILFLILFVFARFIKKKDSTSYSLWFLGFYLLHIVSDFFGADTRLPYGLPIFWPLSESYYLSDVSIFLDIRRSSDLNEFIPSLFRKHNFIAIFVEVVIAAILGLFLFLVKKLISKFRSVSN